MALYYLAQGEGQGGGVTFPPLVLNKSWGIGWLVTPRPTPSYSWLWFKCLMTTLTIFSSSDISPWMDGAYLSTQSVSNPTTHPILQLALVQMFDDDIYSTLLLGYFSMDGAYLSTQSVSNPATTPSYSWLSFKCLMTTFTLLSSSDIFPWMGPTSAPSLSVTPQPPHPTAGSCSNV